MVDEAHRLNEKSGLFQNKGENQIKEIIAEFEGAGYKVTKKAIMHNYCAWLDDFMLGRAPTELSELSPAEMMRQLLRRLWGEALRPCTRRLPAASTPENDARRLTYSTQIRTVERGSWERAVKFMNPLMLT